MIYITITLELAYLLKLKFIFTAIYSNFISLTAFSYFI